MTPILAGLRSLGAARLVALGIVAVGMMGLLAVMATHGGNTRMALLYADLDTREAGQMVDALERAHIPHQTNAAGTEILVPTESVANARLLLAKENLPTGGSIGYEIFDRGENLSASQFQQTINQTRALEGELVRTIRMIHGVRAARVHLVLPHREPFAREIQDAQASVLLTTSGVEPLDHESVQAVLNLVAAAVPGLRAKNIAIADTHGNLLARAGDQTEGVQAARNGEELRHATEMRLARSVEQVLEPSLGQGRVHAEAAVEMNFEQVRETEEKFDPDGQVPRSTHSMTDSTKSTEQNPSVSVQNNLPNNDAGNANATGSQEQKQDETTNYEIGKTSRTVLREQPRIQRVSLAVLVDGVEDRGADGKLTYRERTPDELEQIAKLVRTTIGFDEKRGDHVEVVNMRFVAEAPAETAATSTLFGIPIEKGELVGIAESVLPAVLALLGLLFVLRPLVLRLTTLPASVAAVAIGDAGFDATMMAASESAGGGGVPRIGGPGGDAAGGLALVPVGATPEEDEMVNVGQIEGQIKSSSIKRIVEMADKYPNETLAIVRTWMTQEAAE